MSAHAASDITWDLQERCSGSGRLSTQARKEGLCVGFPVDFRYGWDLRNPRHRSLLDEVGAFFKPLVEFSAPDCRLWSAARRKVDVSRETIERQLELPALQWLLGLCQGQAMDNAFFAHFDRAVVNNHRSGIL